MSSHAWEIAVESVADRSAYVGWRRVRDDMLVHPDGRGLWLLHPPQVRAWRDGIVTHERPVEWRWIDGESGTELHVAEQCTVDLVHLAPEAARAFLADRSRPMRVAGSGHDVAQPGSLRNFLAGTAVVEPHPDGERRESTEQAMLSLYRIARLRGNAFWDGVARHLAAATVERVERAPQGLVGLEGGMCHTRLLIDAALLLAAEHELDPAGPWAAPLQKAIGALDLLSVEWGGGRWYLHDTRERDADEIRLVLNTHVHALIARLAVGLPIDDGLRSLDHALTLHPPRTVGFLASALMTMSDLVLAVCPNRFLTTAVRLARPARAISSRVRRRWPHLVMRNGFIARDVIFPHNAGYFIVNLNDLAVLERNRPTDASSSALRRGLAYASRTRFFRVQRRLRDPLSVVVPNTLFNAGRAEVARQEAATLSGVGVAPTIGWPDHRDALWSRLDPGTP